MNRVESLEFLVALIYVELVDMIGFVGVLFGTFIPLWFDYLLDSFLIPKIQ